MGRGSCKVLAEDSMTIYEAVKQKTTLLQALQKHTQMEIDLSNVDEMDTAGLQVLLLVKRTAEKAGKTVRLVAHSPASLDVLDRYNLATFFGDPVVISSARR
jgi:anti-sigma B factor antagonist